MSRRGTQLGASGQWLEPAWLSLAVFFASLFIAGSCFSAPSAEERQLFESLYGDSIGRVTRTPDVSDDVELASSLFEAGGSVKDQPNLRILLYEHASSLGSRGPGGHETAIQSLRLIGRLDEDRMLESQQKIVALLQASHQQARGTEARKAAAGKLLDGLVEAGEACVESGEIDQGVGYLKRGLAISSVVGVDGGAIQSRLDDLVYLQQKERKAAALKARFKANPRDKEAAAALSKFYLVEMHSPRQAASFAKLSGDDELKRRTTMAKLPLEMLKEDACLELGSWYLELGDEAEKDNQKWLYEKSQSSFDRYLSIHENQSDLGATRAKLSLSSLKAKMAKLDEVAVKPPPRPSGGPDKKAWPHNQPRTATWVKLRSTYSSSGVRTGTYYLALLKGGKVIRDGKPAGTWGTQRNRLILKLDVGTQTFDTRGGRFTAYDYYVYLTKTTPDAVAAAMKE